MANTNWKDVLQRLLDSVPNGIDKREGSIIYDALAPCAIELQLMYEEIYRIIDRAYPDTATGVDLERKVYERGIVRVPASKAVVRVELKGEGNTPYDISIGTRFSGNLIDYITVRKIDSGVYAMEAEQAGTVGNLFIGEVIPIDSLQGFLEANITEILIYGAEAESDESLRDRYYASLQSMAFGGNIADYEQKAHSLQGVGLVKVLPVPDNIGGKVKLTITDASYQPATEGLIEYVREAFNPSGDYLDAGLGLAPIGHFVEVSTVQKYPIDIDIDVKLEDDIDIEIVKSEYESLLQEYFLSLTKAWEKREIVVRISQVQARLLDCEGVLDAMNVRMNGDTQNIRLGFAEIPFLRTYNVTKI